MVRKKWTGGESRSKRDSAPNSAANPELRIPQGLRAGSGIREAGSADGFRISEKGAKEKRSGGEPPLLFCGSCWKDRLLDNGLEEPDFELSIVVFATENLDSAIDNAEHETI